MVDPVGSIFFLNFSSPRTGQLLICPCLTSFAQPLMDMKICAVVLFGIAADAIFYLDICETVQICA